MVTDLFKTGKIYLVKTPVRGNAGIPRLHGMIMSGELGVRVAPESKEEIYFIFVTKNLKSLLIFHQDEAGLDYTKRFLFNRKFKIQLEEQANPVRLTREQLRRMVLDGSYEGEWESIYLKQKIEAMECQNKIV